TRRDLPALARSLVWPPTGLIVFGIALVFAEMPSGAFALPAMAAVLERCGRSGGWRTGYSPQHAPNILLVFGRSRAASRCTEGASRVQMRTSAQAPADTRAHSEM
ncbi:MAG: hypothetical protein M3322_02230, partial [Actinomycetota bacterium]|nr:hypothetical protein [Actinomycetota bacterium]